MKKIIFITGNSGKYVEMVEKFKPLGFTIVQKDVGYPEIQADTLEDVARFGIPYVKKKISGPFVLEDAGLFINTLGGFPGVYSKFVYYSIGIDGIVRLVAEYPEEKRTAVFRSVFGLHIPDEEPLFFVGECIGKISIKKRGSSGFGYDPIFIPDGEIRTFAEMTVEEKNRFSHRGKALEKLSKYLIKEKKEGLM